MVLTNLITEGDYDFASGSADSDNIIFQQIPGDRQDFLRNSPATDAIALLGGGDRYEDDGDSRIVFGNTGDDTLYGHDGNDTLAAGRDRDWVEGGNFDDILFGNLGDDVVRGGNGNDIIFGGQDGDRLLGDAGHDIVSGDLGDDTLTGGVGTDTLSGGSGADVFYLSRDDLAATAAEADKLTDFNAAEGDRIAFSGQDIDLSELRIWSDGRIELQSGGVLAVVQSEKPEFDDFRFLTSANDDDWLGRVNQLRSLAGLPPVTENPEWSEGGVLHSRYLVKNDTRGHTEDPSNPWYTPAGEAAGQAGNVTTSSSVNRSAVDAIDGWMNAPFHGIGIIDPELTQVGFGSYSEADGGVQSAATLDVIRGLGNSSSVLYPVFWPQNGTQVPITEYDGGEFPDPLSGSAFTAPTGVPIYLQLGSGNVTPNVTRSALSRDGVPQPHLIFDETTYSNPDPNAQSLGRNVLDSRDAIVLMPQAPLAAGATYEVSISANGNTYTWSFGVQALDEAALLLG